MKITDFIAQNRLVVLKDGDGDTRLVSLLPDGAHSLALVTDGESMCIPAEVPVVCFNINQINAHLGEEWNWDGLIAEAAKRAFSISRWDKDRVEAAFAGVLGAP